MSKLIKGVLVILVLWAVWHVGVSYYRFYTFEDAVKGMAQLGGVEPEDKLAAQVVGLAADSKVPLRADDVRVRKEIGQIVVEASYVDRVEVLPRYRYPITHRLSVRVLVLAGLPTNRR